MIDDFAEKYYHEIKETVAYRAFTSVKIFLFTTLFLIFALDWNHLTAPKEFEQRMYQMFHDSTCNVNVDSLDYDPFCQSSRKFDAFVGLLMLACLTIAAICYKDWHIIHYTTILGVYIAGCLVGVLTVFLYLFSWGCYENNVLLFGISLLVLQLFLLSSTWRLLRVVKGASKVYYDRKKSVSEPMRPNISIELPE